MTDTTTQSEVSDLSITVTNLMKGAVYRDTNDRLFAQVLTLRSAISDYVSVIGLRLDVDEAEGYAYLRSIETNDDAQAIPRLIARRSLSYHVSLLLALLRKKLAEFDATSSDTRLVISRDQVVEMMRVFLSGSSNEARLSDQIDSHINKIIELGFLRRLRNQSDQFEVRRIIKAFVDGQWLSDFDAKLAAYRRTETEVTEP